ncbi:hypothetical protein [Mycoplasma hafezii]|uniref:hypothetical protein n=1 Tax=Mycoplasma hafezii TaxID=525886 RepID=UPI003CF780C4
MSKIQKSYFIIWNIFTIIFLLIGFFSLIYIGIKSITDPAPVILVPAATPDWENLHYGYSFDMWDYYKPCLFLGIALYFLQFIEVLSKKNKVLYALFPVFFIKKINFTISNKIFALIWKFIIFITLIAFFGFSLPEYSIWLFRLDNPYWIHHWVILVFWIFDLLLFIFYPLISVIDFKLSQVNEITKEISN